MNFSIPGLGTNNRCPFYQLSFKFEHRFSGLKFKFEHLIVPNCFELMHLKNS